MANAVNHFSSSPLYFAYRRKSENYEHRETFHSHLGVEVLYIHEGKGTMIVNNNSYEIKPNMLCIFQPFQLHHLKLEYDHGQVFERSISIIDPSVFESYFQPWPSLLNFYRFIHAGKLPYPCLYDIDDPHLDSVFKSMHDRLPALSDADQYEEISLYLISLFRCLKQIWDHRKENGTVYAVRRKHHRVEEILSWIEHNYTHAFRLDDMAKALHLSPYHVSHLFKETTGMSIIEYIAARRIHQAVRLLTTTNKPISLIAEKIGLTNSSYFCKLFKSQMGITPHQYRKQWLR